MRNQAVERKWVRKSRWSVDLRKIEIMGDNLFILTIYIWYYIIIKRGDYIELMTLAQGFTSL